MLLCVHSSRVEAVLSFCYKGKLFLKPRVLFTYDKTQHGCSNNKYNFLCVPKSECAETKLDVRIIPESGRFPYFNAE